MSKPQLSKVQNYYTKLMMPGLKVEYLKSTKVISKSSKYIHKYI